AATTKTTASHLLEYMSSSFQQCAVRLWRDYEGRLRGLARACGALLLRRRLGRALGLGRRDRLLGRGGLRRRRRRNVRIVVGRAGTVEAPVVVRLTDDLADVVLRFRERNVVDELVAIDTGALGDPAVHAAWPGVVRGERVMHAAELPNEIGEIGGAHAKVRF